MHTKGPWIFKEVETSIGRAFKINTPARIDDNHGLVVCIYDDSTSLNKRSHDEHQANARLIAAAPELLEALEWSYCELEERDFNREDVLEVLAKAIRTAKGE